MRRNQVKTLRGSRDDFAGNRTCQSAETIKNVLTGDANFIYKPDAFGTGSLASKIDRNTSAAQSFNYRADGKLTHFEKTELSADYKFDALGRRVAKVITPSSGTSYSQSYLHLVDQDKVILGKSGTGDVTLYLDGEWIDEHLGEANSNGVKAYASDHLGSVLNSQASGGVTFSAGLEGAAVRAVGGLSLFKLLSGAQPLSTPIAGPGFSVASRVFITGGTMAVNGAFVTTACEIGVLFGSAASAFGEELADYLFRNSQQSERNELGLTSNACPR